MQKYYTFVISVVLLFTSVCGYIQLNSQNQDKPLTTTTLELLSSFKQCIVFIFDWALDSYVEPSTSTNYFIFYSKSVSCALIIDTCMKYRNKSLTNQRFELYQPHTLYTKRITTLINLSSSAVTSTVYKGKPATAYIPSVIRMYNIPFNYVLLFISKERIFSVKFSECLAACAPAVYITILDEEEVNIVGFAHALQSAPFLFKVKTLQESHFQHVHQTIHNDLQHSILGIIWPHSPQKCTLSWIMDLGDGSCVLGSLIENFNMTYCNHFDSACPGPEITIIKPREKLSSHNFVTRRTIHYEFINYFHYYFEFCFICIVETGSKSFMAFVEAFDPSTWIVTTIVSMGLSVTVAAMSNKTASSLWTKLQPSFVVVLMLLFDRFYAQKKLQLAASKQTILVLTLWAFGAMLLGMSYSGKMISELAAPSLPPLPQDMHELSQVEYPILTTEYTTETRNGKQTEIGHIHNQIKYYLEDKPGENTTLINDLRRLKSAVTVINNSWTKRRPNISCPKSSKVLFAYADHPVRVEASRKWSRISSDSLRPSPQRDLPFFKQQNHMILLSNSLLPIFRKFLAIICEAGITLLWRDINYADASRVMILEHFERFPLVSSINTRMLGEGLKKRITLATIWRDFDSLLGSSSSWNQITLDTLNPAFQLFVVGLLISTLLLFQERWPLHVACLEMFSIGRKYCRGLIKNS